MKKKKASVNLAALRAAKKTLKSIKFDEFWNEVIRRVTPNADANARIRALSLAKASSKVLC